MALFAARGQLEGLFWVISKSTRNIRRFHVKLSAIPVTHVTYHFKAYFLYFQVMAVSMYLNHANFAQSSHVTMETAFLSLVIYSRKLALPSKFQCSGSSSLMFHGVLSYANKFIWLFSSIGPNIVQK